MPRHRDIPSELLALALHRSGAPYSLIARVQHISERGVQFRIQRIAPQLRSHRKELAAVISVVRDLQKRAS